MSSGGQRTPGQDTEAAASAGSPEAEAPPAGDSLAHRLAQRFPALRSRDFRLLWYGQTISAAGSMMQVWAINWHLYLLTGKPIALGMVGLFRFVPIVVFSLLGGAVADARDRRRVMLITQSCLAAVALAMALLTVRGWISATAIYALTVAGAAAIAFDNPARQSLVPNLVPREDFPNAAALNSSAFQVSQILGPLLAGVLIAQKQLALCYLLNAASFGAVIWALLLMGPNAGMAGRRPAAEGAAASNGPEEASESEERGAVSLSALLEGLAFVWRTRILVWTMGLDFLATFFSSASTLLPIFALDVLHVKGRGYGLLAAAQAFGSLSAGITISSRPPIERQGLTVLWAVVVFGIATIVFGASHWFWLSWVALAVVGASDTVSTILRQTIRQLVSPDRLRGRMSAVNMVFFMGGPQLGEFEAGVVASLAGAPFSVVTGGAACLLCTGWIAARAASLREYRHSTRVQEE